MNCDKNIRRNINEQHINTSGETRPGESIAHRIEFSRISKSKGAERYTRLEKSWQQDGVTKKKNRKTDGDGKI